MPVRWPYGRNSPKWVEIVQAVCVIERDDQGNDNILKVLKDGIPY